MDSIFTDRMAWKFAIKLLGLDYFSIVIKVIIAFKFLT